MNFEDATLVRLADAATRSGVFDEPALEQLVATAYDAATMSVEGPYQPLFDEFRIGLALPGQVTVDGRWMPPNGAPHSETQLRLAGLDSGQPARVDALWRGSIVARTRPVGEPIEVVDVARAELAGIDDEIAADLGALPADPATLEQERRARLRARLQALLDHPEMVTEANLDAWLAQVGATSAGEFVARVEPASETEAVTVTFAPLDPAPPSPRPLPFVGAILIRAAVALVDLLAESRAVRERLGRMGLERPPASGAVPRQPLVVVWVVPATTFDDPDWPGADENAPPNQQRAQRRTAAGDWLAREGIGLVVVE